VYVAHASHQVMAEVID